MQPGPASQSATNGERHQLGVLFVHGIGEQPEGETLLAFGEPLIRWLRRWVSRKDGNRQPGSVDVLESHLTPARFLRKEPAHTLIEISPGGDCAPAKWMLAESWWADEMRRPRFGKLAAWLLTVGAWMVLSHGFRGAWTRERAPRWAVRDVWIALRSIPLAALMQVVVMLLAVLAVIPIPKLRSALSAFLVKVTGVLGDSYVLLESDMQRTAVVARIRRDLAWLALSCQKVVVVAHSQGAAVAHRALRAPEPENVAALVTFGSGLSKLEELQQMTTIRRARLRLLQIGVPLFFLAAIQIIRVMVQFRQDWLAERGLIWAFVPVVLLLTAVMMARSDAREFDGHVRGLALYPVRPHLEWQDLYASADPVSNGPLARNEVLEEMKIQSAQVTNRMSALWDHTSYWENAAEFIPSVLEILSAKSGLPLFDAAEISSLDHAALEHTKHVRWLAWVRRATALSVVIAVIALWNHLEPMGRSLIGALGRPPLESVGKILTALQRFASFALAAVLSTDPSGVESASYRLVGALAPLLLVALWQKLHFFLWRWWEGLTVNHIFAPQKYPYHPADRASVNIFVISAGFVPLVLVIAFAVRPDWLSGVGMEARFYRLSGGAIMLVFFLSGVVMLWQLLSSVWTGGRDVLGRLKAIGIKDIASGVLSVSIFLVIALTSIGGAIASPIVIDALAGVMVLAFAVKLHASLMNSMRARNAGPGFRWAGRLIPPAHALLMLWYSFAVPRSKPDILAAVAGAYMLGVLTVMAANWLRSRRLVKRARSATAGAT